MANFNTMIRLVFFIFLFHLCNASVGRVLKHLCINRDCSAKRITTSNPPVNLWDANVITQFNAFMRSLSDRKTKVVVFDSDIADFWAASIDLNLFLPNPIPGRNSSELLNTYYANLDLILSTLVIFIGEVNGRA